MATVFQFFHMENKDPLYYMASFIAADHLGMLSHGVVLPMIIHPKHKQGLNLL